VCYVPTIEKGVSVITSITIYDGATTIGGSKIYLENERGGVFLDFGLNFAKYNEYFQEFLKERGVRGVHDLIYLGLIPKLGIYRQDLAPSDVDFQSYPRLKVDAVLLSHAHLDHCGNLGLLRGEMPIVASQTSVAILKALRDTAPSSMGSEVTYYSEKKPVEGCEGLVLESDYSSNYVSRDFYCVTEPSDGLKNFVSGRPGEKSAKKKVEPGKLCHMDELDLPFEVSAFPVDHSLYGAVGYILKAKAGPTIAYTGDFRLHGINAEMTRKFIANAKEASVLIIEGTRVSRNDTYNVSEEEVFANCLRVVGEAPSKKLVIADFSARNFERLERFLEVARRTGRELVVTAKDAYMLHAIGCSGNGCIMEDRKVRIYRELKNPSRCKWEDEVVRGLWGEKYVDPGAISKQPGDYILCFSFYDMKHLLDIKPHGGTYIYSSSEAFSEEDTFDFIRLGRWVDFFGLKTYGFKIVDEGHSVKPVFEWGFHASGHASREEIESTIVEIDPDVLVPVHTQAQDWFKEKFENAVTPDEGKRFAL
jgi:ribonuclease J